MKFEIQPATIDDASDILDLQTRSWKATFGDHMTDEEIETRFSNYSERRTGLIDRIKNQPHINVFVIREKEELAGFISLEELEGEQMIRTLHVSSNFQGSGLGKKLILFAINYFDDTLPISLKCREKNIKALGFYQHFGFKITETLPQKPGDSFVLLKLKRPPQDSISKNQI